MDKTEEAENMASSINVPSVHQQASVSAPVITEKSMHGRQCSALVRDLKPSVKPIISTEAAMRGNEMDRTKTVIGAGSQRATTQPEVKFASSKPSISLSADQNRLPITFGGIPSGVFQVPQLANTQNQYLPSQGPNFASNAKNDFFIRSSLPKLKLAEFSGDPLEWPEWSQLFQATVHAANIDDSVKMNHLKTMVTGKAKEAIAGLAVFTEWLNDIAAVQDEMLLSSNPIADHRAKPSYKEKAKRSTFATSATNTASDNSKYQRECVLKDGKHPIWKCEKFKKMNVEERGQKAKELKLCFKCLSDAYQMRTCSGRLSDVDGCRKHHHRLLQRS